jgi:PqqD family protein of HPr-rel-A system
MKYEKNKSVSVKKVDNEVFAYNRSTGKIHAFNETGSFLLSAMGEKASPESLAPVLAREYDVDEKTAQKDIEEFLRELDAKGLVSKCDD